MTLKQTVDQHNKWLLEMKERQRQHEINLDRLEKSMIDLVNQQAEVKRSIIETNHSVGKLSNRIDNYIKSLGQRNGRKT